VDDWLSVAEAAQRLGVSERRVRQLLDAGELAVGWVGPYRVIDEASVRRRASSRPGAGRPLGQPLAWIVIDVLSHPGSAAARPKDRRLRHRLRRVLVEEHSVAEWALLLRRRAVQHRYWGHPGIVSDLRVDRRVSSGGARAAAAHGLDVSVVDDVGGYVDHAALHEIEQDFALEPDVRGDVLLCAYDASLLGAPIGGKPIPVAAAALDLLDSPDVRLAHAGRSWLQRALSNLVLPEAP
jgi:excisionase family DNA binding protein